ncbi:MAG TPA: glycosyl hydrolase [Acidimicrobiales bacterium]|nr:glycosyl hydrolase [Acidimicrobiales bacterium]
MRRGAIGAALMVLALSTVAGCGLPHVASNALGFFVPSQSPGDVDALATHLGVEVEGISGYTSQSSWTAIGAYQPPSTSLRLYLGVSMSPQDSSPAQTPANLGVYVQLAKSLVNAGQAYAILRVGWEWSTTYYSWGVQNTTPAQYVTAFDDIVTTMRSVPGQHFFFDWCAAADEVPTNGSYAASYPGDQYVDYIGTDQYDNPGSSWADTLNTVGGLSYTVDFAKAHDKFVSVPEWGLNGADDPTFINLMHGFIENPSNEVGYSSYFSYDGAVDSDITQFPQSQAAFAQDFG